MKIAIMQPYLFPYLGYFQLIHAVDAFVFYDDAAYRKQGWINRNRILSAGASLLFSVPILNASSSTPIKQTRIHEKQLPGWRQKFLRTLRQEYADSPRVDRVTGLVEGVLGDPQHDIAALAQRSVEACCEYVGLDVTFRVSSRDFPPSGARGVERVLEICRAAKATHYVNPPGGRELYHAELFQREGLSLSFLKPELAPYPQGGLSFIPGLSIIDVFMRMDASKARESFESGALE